VIDSVGIINTVGGSTPGGSGVGDNGPPANAQFNFPNKITFDSEGNLFIAEKNSSRIREIVNPLSGFSGADVVLASEDGSELYQFDPNGRHLKTINASNCYFCKI